MTTTFDCRESESRPSQSEQDAAICRMFDRARAKRDAALKAEKPVAAVVTEYTLAEPHWTHTFAVCGDTVTLTVKRLPGASGSTWTPSRTMTKAQARKEYARLLDAGCWKW